MGVKKKSGKKRPVCVPEYKLTAKQDQFCCEYILDFNATQSAIRAGYSRKTAKTIAGQNLSKLPIQNRIKMLVTERQERTATSADKALIECRRIALADVGEAFNPDGMLKGIHDIPEDVRRAIGGFEVIETFEGKGEDRVWTGYLKKVKFWSKDKQIELLFRHHGMFQKDNAQQPATVIKTQMVIVRPNGGD